MTQKKLLNLIGIYGICALSAGVFYREFTRWNNFTERTSLGVLHPHLLILGVGLLLIILLFSLQTDLLKQAKFQKFYKFYRVALPMMVTMLLVRGVAQVLRLELSRGVDMSISGLAGLSHILLTVALVYLFSALKLAVLGKSKS